VRQRSPGANKPISVNSMIPPSMTLCLILVVLKLLV
jgi:hypothetical protein